MSDLLNFDDDTDNLFKPSEPRAKPSRNLDDIFGTSSEAVTAGSNLDDVLVPGVQDDIFDVKPKSSSQKKSTARNVDSLFGDVDDEPDIFSTMPGKSLQQALVSEQTEDDLLADFLSSTESAKQDEKTADEYDMFGEMPRHTGAGGSDIDDIFEANQVEHTSQFSVPAPVMESEDKGNQSLDSLDMLLDAQPEGTVPASDDLFSLIEPIKLTSDSFLKESVNATSDADDIDHEFQDNKSEVQAEPVSQSEHVEESHVKEHQSEDILDMLLDAQPTGTVPVSDDLHSLIEPIINTAADPNKHTADHGDITETKKSEVSVEPAVYEEPPNDEDDHSLKDLDNILDAQPVGTVAASDDLLSLAQPVGTVAASDDLLSLAQPVGTVAASDDLLSLAQPVGTVAASDDLLSLAQPVGTVAASDDLLSLAQPVGTVAASDDLLSLVDPLTNLAASSNTHAAHSSDYKDSEEKGGDLPDTCGVEPSQEESSEQEEEKDQELEERSEEPVQSKPKTNLKKSMERSFEDLLNGLSDESEPELDDMIDDGTDNTNLESILGSPDKIIHDIQSDVSPGEFTTPKRPFDDPFDMDFLSSTPNEKTAESVEVKVTTPEDEVYTLSDKEDEDNVEWGNSVGDSRDDRIEGDIVMVEDTEVVMRHKPTAAADEQDFDVGDANYLDVDAHKHKSALGKQGSLALRRKPSRKSRRSLLSAGEDAIFQDSTEPKPTDLTNGDAEPGDDDGEERLDLSPPAKKPSPAMMLPLPGMAGRPPSQRLSSSPDDTEDNNAMDTKETKRLSKPPAGAFVLPALGPRPPKPQRPETITSDKPPAESKPVMFEKPALKPVRPVEKPDQDEDLTPGFSPAGLRPTRRQEVEERGDSEEKDFTYKRPSLRSTPKPTRDRTPEDNRDRNSGLFEKPVLRSTPKPKIEQKPSDNKEPEVFETRNLRNAQKPVTETVIDTSEDRHVFDKPSLRSTSKRLESESDAVFTEPSSNQGANLFEKPQLRTTNRDQRSDSTDDSKTEQVYTFNKPTLRSASRRTSESPGSEHSSSGVFEKPCLKKTTPSPEKEAKDSYEPKGTFDRPALRKTQAAKEREERAKVVEKEKPEWLQEAANKHTKVLDVLQAKENQHSSSEKQVPSWLEKPALRKTRAQPLQDTSNGQSTHDGQSDTSEDTGKTSTPRSRNSSMGSENDPERKRTPATGTQNNYTPSWMRQQKSPAVPTGMTGLTASKSLPSQSTTAEIPQWKLELAQRRQTRKGVPEEGQKKEEDSEPDWKKGVALRKTRNSLTPSREVHKEEPEWKKAAEEKRARLRNSSAAGHTDHSDHS